jgi:hypothetical protein
VFLTSLVALAFITVKGNHRLFGACHETLAKGFFAIVAAAIAALLFNDSGIVAAATTIIYVVVPLLYWELSQLAKT